MLRPHSGSPTCLSHSREDRTRLELMDTVRREEWLRHMPRLLVIFLFGVFAVHGTHFGSSWNGMEVPGVASKDRSYHQQYSLA